MLVKKVSVKKEVKDSQFENQAAISTSSFASSPAPIKKAAEIKKNSSSKTTIKVKFDVGFSNALYIRGEGKGLSWDHGILLKNTKADEWTWENNEAFGSYEFKILINDRIYENGKNHQLKAGESFSYTPNFS